MPDRVPGTKYAALRRYAPSWKLSTWAGSLGRLTPEQVATEYGSRIEQGLISLII